MASFYLTSDVVFRTLGKLYYSAGNKPVSTENLITALRQNGYSDDYTGSLECQVDAHLNRLNRDGRVFSHRPGFYVPAGSIQHSKSNFPPPFSPWNQPGSPNQHPASNFPPRSTPWYPPSTGFQPDKHPYFGNTPMTPPFYTGPAQSARSEPVYQPWLPSKNHPPSFPPWETKMDEAEDEDERPPPGVDMTPIPTDPPAPFQGNFESALQAISGQSAQSKLSESSRPASLESSSRTGTMLTTTAPSSDTDTEMPNNFRPTIVTSGRFHQFVAEAKADGLESKKPEGKRPNRSAG